MKKLNSLMMSAVILGSFTFASCDDDSNSGGGGGSGNQSTFVISATVGDANYLLTADNLTEGTLTAVGRGKETNTGSFWLYHADQYLFRLVYNQGSNSISSSYELNSQGRVVDREGTYAIRRFTTYGIYGNLLITTSTGALESEQGVSIVDHPAGTQRTGYPRGFFVNHINMDTEVNGTIRELQISEDYFGNGEFVTFAGILEANGKIFTAPIPMGMSHWGVVRNADKILHSDLVKTTAGGSGSSAFTPGELQWTQYPNEAYVAIYNDENFSNPRLLRTDKISYAAGRSASQYYQMIWRASNGDIYVFSPSYAKVMEDHRQRTTLPAGVVRIKAGANDFDPNYYVNIEAQSGGVGFLQSWHISGDYFLLRMYDEPFSPGVTSLTATRLAIFKGEEGTLTYVTGLPASIASIANTPYFEKGKIYMPVLEPGQDPAIYIIDAVTATAVKGISVKAEAITSVGRLSYRK